MKSLNKQKNLLKGVCVFVLTMPILLGFLSSYGICGLERISIINLIATPEKYNNKDVSLIGYAQIKFEHVAIFMSKEDADNFISKNAIWLSFSEEDYANYITLNNKYVLVEGKFDASSKGHAGQYSGTIKEITRFEVNPILHAIE